MAALALPQLKSVANRPETLTAIAAVSIILMLIVPLPFWLLDGLIALNITIALGVLMLTFYVTKPLEFSSFPSMLLLLTLFRLALNVASTRLILADGEAGSVIHAFGTFVVGGNFVVGVVVFTILVVIQFVVITHGAGRVAEVAARFTLDAMPGKQMAIDAELNAGVIDEETARERRGEVNREADFYGSMDGASKFVRGDAIAAVVMIVVNILGGFAIGMLQRNMDVMQAIDTYARLTIGEGLVSQVPALLISAASGLIVTRTAGKESLGKELGSQLVARPQALLICSGLLLLLAMVPGLPKLPFLSLAAAVGYAGWQIRKKQNLPPPPPAPVEKAPENLTDLLGVDPLEVELGYGLVCLADVKSGGDLLDRVTSVRRQIASEMGFVVPPIRVRDNVRLKATQYVVRLRGAEIGGGELHPDQLLALDTGNISQQVPGIPTEDPSFGLPALWISKGQRTFAEVSGYTVVDPSSVMITHLAELLRRHAPEVLGRQDVQELLNAVKAHSPAVVEELIPGLLTLGQVQKVLQMLLRERVSIRDLSLILEALADGAALSREPEFLAEQARQRLARTLTSSVVNQEGRLYCFTLHPAVEQTLADNLRKTDAGAQVALDPTTMQRMMQAIQEQCERMMLAGHQPVALCSSRSRLAMHQISQRVVPSLVVMSYSEIVAGTPVESVGMVSWTNEDSKI